MSDDRVRIQGADVERIEQLLITIREAELVRIEAPTAGKPDHKRVATIKADVLRRILMAAADGRL